MEFMSLLSFHFSWIVALMLFVFPVSIWFNAGDIEGVRAAVYGFAGSYLKAAVIGYMPLLFYQWVASANPGTDIVTGIDVTSLVLGLGAVLYCRVFFTRFRSPWETPNK